MWISVKKQLPKGYEEVLVKMGKNRFGIAIYYGKSYYDNVPELLPIFKPINVLCTCSDSFENVEFDKEIIEWQPLNVLNE